jgi:tetratricopeptide (TPR) repeat protein
LTEARREFEKTVALDFYFAPGHFGLGYARLQEGRPVAAAESFSTAVHLRPDWPEAYYMLGVSHSSAGFPEKAERAWERFLALDPASPLAAQVRSLIGRAR